MRQTRITAAGWWLLAAIGLSANLWIGVHVAESGADFNHFYAAAQLVGTGHLYDWSGIQQVERPHSRTLLHFGRLPFYAYTIKWMATLPYATAHSLCLLMSGLSLLIFAAFWPTHSRGRFFVTLLWSCPAAILLAIGQDDALVLLCWTVGLLLIRSNRDLLAGLVFSLCAAKFHLALGIPIFLVARRKWTVLAAAAAGGTAQLLVSFAVEGPTWPVNLLHAISSADFSPAADKMPNLHGLIYRLPHSAVLEVCLSLMVLGALWLIAQRSTLAISAAATLLAGLLVGRHAYAYDCVLMLPAIELMRRSAASVILRCWAIVLAEPIPFLLLMSQRTAMIGQLLIVGFSLVLLAWLAARSVHWRLRTPAGLKWLDGFARAMAPSGSSAVSRRAVSRRVVRNSE